MFPSRRALPHQACSRSRCSRLIGSRTPTSAAAPSRAQQGEARNALARALYFCRLGEVRDRGFENQFFRAPGSTCWPRPSYSGTRSIWRWPTRSCGARADDQRRPVAACRTARLRAHRADRETTFGALPINRRPVRSDRCGSGNHYWRPEFARCSRCRTLRALSCSDPSLAEATSRQPPAGRTSPRSRDPTTCPTRGPPGAFNESVNLEAV
jgi:hypothetical protein